MVTMHGDGAALVRAFFVPRGRATGEGSPTNVEVCLSQVSANYPGSVFLTSGEMGSASEGSAGAGGQP